MKKIIEIYINGKLYKSCPYNRWDSYDVEDFSQYEKIEDVAGTPKKEWVKIAR